MERIVAGRDRIRRKGADSFCAGPCGCVSDAGCPIRKLCASVHRAPCRARGGSPTDSRARPARITARRLLPQVAEDAELVYQEECDAECLIRRATSRAV